MSTTPDAKDSACVLHAAAYVDLRSGDDGQWSETWVWLTAVRR